MTDIVERLHDLAHACRLEWLPSQVEDVNSAAAEIERLRAERDAFKQTIYDEMDANHRLRSLGGARDDEPMTPFLERVIAERGALRDLLSDCRIALMWPGEPAQEFLDRIDAAMAPSPTAKAAD